MTINKDDMGVFGSVTLTNDIYTVVVEDEEGLEGIGRYSIETGPGHPAGPGELLLLWSYLTVRSYSSKTDYVQVNDPSEFDQLITDAGFTILRLDPTFTVIASGDKSISISHGLNDTDQNDNMGITQIVTILGDTVADSRIDITTFISNINDPNDPESPSLLIGVRYFWDIEFNGDKGPTFQAINPNGAVLTTEQTFNNPNFEAYELKNNQGSPILMLGGTVNGPTFDPPPVPPTKLQYASWLTSNIHTFDYETTGISTDDDSALLTFWGDNEENAFLIPPGETVVVRTLLYTPAQAQPPSRGIQFSPAE